MADLPISTHVIEFPYTRTLGPVFGPYLTGLRDGQLLGIRSNDGRVLSPPLEWDPATGLPIDTSALVPIGPGGVVETWAWVTHPTVKHPLDHPFAFALIRLDGADTALVHAVDAGSIDTMRTGMRVTARWNDERVGAITDVVFVPEGAS
ncbi:MAG: hypothetical protein AMXMBFR46_22840 [Acidimicrobiia bacterium]